MNRMVMFGNRMGAGSMTGSLCVCLTVADWPWLSRAKGISAAAQLS